MSTEAAGRSESSGTSTEAAGRSESPSAWREVVCGVLLLGVVVAFWVQRESSGAVTASFPDVVLGVLTLLGVGIIVRGVRSGAWQREPRQVDLRFLGAGAVLLLGWAVAMGLIGFTISSVITFVVIAQLIHRERPTVATVLKDTVVGTAIVVACFFVFTRVLLVPLPVSVVIGM